MYPWYYVWSPRYTFFHFLLFSQIRDLSGFEVHPLFFPQSIFTRKEPTDGQHFLTGIGIKIYVLLKNLQTKPGEFVVFSDVDIVCLDKNLAAKFQAYEKYDITCMREALDSNHYNIGCMLVKSTPDTIAFFTKVLERIRVEQRLDQDIFNEEIQSFPGTHGHFDIPAFIQSNMMETLQQEDKYSVIQCLCSATDPDLILVEKIATITNFIDITTFRSHLSSTTEELLREYLQEKDPLNYVLQWPRRLPLSTDKLT